MAEYNFPRLSYRQRRMKATISASRTTPPIDSPTARSTVFNDDATVSPSEIKYATIFDTKRKSVIVIPEQKTFTVNKICLCTTFIDFHSDSTITMLYIFKTVRAQNPDCISADILLSVPCISTRAAAAPVCPHDTELSLIHI